MFFLPALIWGLVILAAVSIPSASIPETGLLDIPLIDKFIHFALFSVFGILLASGFFKNQRTGGSGSWRRRIVLSIITGIGYGAITEYWQFCCLTDRHGSLADVLANGFGTVFGVILFEVFRSSKEGSLTTN